jgi:hypothetical protein
MSLEPAVAAYRREARLRLNGNVVIMKKTLIVALMLLLTVVGKGEDRQRVDWLNGTYTVDYKRSTGSVGWNRLFVDYSDIAPYTPIDVSSTNDMVCVAYSRYVGTPTTNEIRIGSGDTDWTVEGSNLLQRCSSSGSTLRLPVPGSSTRVTEYRISIHSDGSIIVRNSMASSGKALWMKGWKSEPVTSTLVLSPVTNINELAGIRKRWEDHNKASHGTGSARP